MMNPNWNTVHVAAWSVDKGLLREHNEDSVAAVDFDLVNKDVIHSVGIYAIADGMGGKEQGEVASKMAAQTAVHQIIQYLMQPEGVLPQDYTEWVTGAVEAANSAVYHTSSDMATTLLLAMVIDNQAHIANVGDTRAYIVTRQEIYQITEDQSFVQELVKAGAITHSQAARHPQRHLLNQAVGLKDTVDVDTFNVVFPSGAYLLLCSDGLTNELTDAMIHSVITQADSPQAACDGLVSEANRSGGRDNISVVLVQLH